MEKEYENNFAIPANYTDSGKLFGGMLETRNTIETAFLLLLIGYPQLMWIPLPTAAKVVVMTVTLLPTGVFGLMGVGGDSLMQYAARMAVFFFRRRKLHYRRVGYHYDKKRTKKPQGVKKKRRDTGVYPGLHPGKGHPERRDRNH